MSPECVDLLTHHSYSSPDPHDTDDISKVMGSKVKVTVTFSGRIESLSIGGLP